jgi:ribosomal protein S12 methylthiotransferase accessory factor
MDEKLEMNVTFPGVGHRVDVHYGPYSFCTDVAPEKGGQGEYMTPGNYFLGAIAACTGSAVLSFIEERDLHIEDMRVIYHKNAETRLIDRIEVKVQVGKDFPEKYLKALERSAATCWVKRQWQHAPEVTIKAEVLDGASE